MYKPTGVDITVLDNPRIINLGDTIRIPAIVGLGPTTRSVVDEAVLRGTGSVDYLAYYPGLSISATQIANTPGIAAGSLSAVGISVNGNLYSLASASVSTTGAVTWTGSGSNVPTAGSIYYITYVVGAPASQYTPTIFSDKQLLAAKHGAESVTTGILTIAGTLALENGAPGVMIVQASGSTYSEALYKTAIDKLQTKKNLEQVICVFPSGSVTRASQESLLTYLNSHVVLMSNNKHERGWMGGSPSPSSATDGLDTIGDTSTAGTYCYRAFSVKGRDIVYVAPSKIQRKDAAGLVMELDGNYAAAAVAGVQSGQPRASIPITGFQVTGLIVENEKWNDFEMNQLAGAGCLVLESRSNVVTIRDQITTDPTSADTQEMSVNSIRRKVQISVREGLANLYTNKGKVVTPSTPNDVEASTASLLQSLITIGEIAEFGQNDDPSTGQLKIAAKQNSQEPRQIDLTFTYKPLYPLKWIVGTASVYV